MQSKLCPQPCPLGFSFGVFVGQLATWPSPESASNSPRIPITGEPFPNVPLNAVLIPARFVSTLNPYFFSALITHSDDLYSSKMSSGLSQI